MLGEPAPLFPGCLPTGADIFNFYKKVRSDGIREGRWKEGVVTVPDVVAVVIKGIGDIWAKTEIPNLCERDQAAAVKEVTKIVKQGRALEKIAISKRKSDFGEKLNCLFDLALCKHADQESCTCSAEDKVPGEWCEYLTDQRGPRKQLALLNRLHLRAPTVPRPSVSPQEKEAIEKEKRRKERCLTRVMKMQKAKLRAEQEVKILKRKVTFESSSEGEEDEGTEENEEDWGDIDEKVPEQNYLRLRNFSRECDRYKLTNRAAAKLGNALLLDVGAVTKSNCSLLLDHSKVRRERSRWGAKLETRHAAKKVPGGLYADGKKCPTLTRVFNSVDVQVI